MQFKERPKTEEEVLLKKELKALLDRTGQAMLARSLNRNAEVHVQTLWQGLVQAILGIRTK